MQQLAEILFLLAIVGYGLAAAVYAYGLTMDRPSAVPRAFQILIIAALAHAVTLSLHLAIVGRLPLGGGPGETALGGWDSPLAGLAWLLAVTAVVIGLKRQAMRILGAFLAPVALGMTLLALLFAGTEEANVFLPDVARSALLPVHIGSNYVSLAFFALAFGSGVAYLLQHSRLKNKDLTLGDKDRLRLPSLEILDTTNRRGFVLGLIFLTVGIVSGTFWVVGGVAEGLDVRPKMVATLVLWLLYALGWQARTMLGWGGRKAAWIAIVGFVGFLVSIVGVAHA